MPDLPPNPTRKRFDTEDAKIVIEALNQQELWPYPQEQDQTNYWVGLRRELEERYSHQSGRTLSLVPASSGTAAIHIALGGLQIPAGSEVIVPPITDMGTIMPVIFQNCIPVFADVDEQTGLLTADSLRAKITERTRAVIVVHLSGSPADVDPIMELCRTQGIRVIEDAAQALGATYKGRPAGTISDAGAFSLNSWKHVTAGEGGFVLVDGRETEDNFLRCLNFADKHRNRMKSPSNSEHDFYAGSGLNFRMSDLELALTLTQFRKLDGVAAKFNELGAHLDERLGKMDRIRPQLHQEHPKSRPVYFFAFFRLLGSRVERDQILGKLRPIAGQMGMGLAASYGEKPLYAYDVFQKRNFFDTVGQPDNANPIWPAELVARRVFPHVPDSAFDYRKCAGECPNAEMWIDTGFGLYFNESHGLEHMDAFADALADVLN